MNLARFGSSAAESEKLYVKALELAPDAALLNVNYAKFLINTRRAPQAVDYIRRAINSQPGDPDFWNTLAVAYAYSNRMKLALEAFEAAAKLAPSNLNYRRNAESIRQILNQRRELRHRSRR